SGREPVAVQLVADDDRRPAVRVFEHAPDRQRTAEHLLRIVVVIAVVEDAAQVLLRLGPPDDLAKRDAFPHAHPARATDVEASHSLGEPDRIPLAEFEQTLEIEGSAVLLGELLAECRGPVRVGDDFEPPRLARQSDFATFLVGNRMRKRLAARDILEFVRRREVWFNLLERLGQLGWRGFSPRERGASDGPRGARTAE